MLFKMYVVVVVFWNAINWYDDEPNKQLVVKLASHKNQQILMPRELFCCKLTIKFQMVKSLLKKRSCLFVCLFFCLNWLFVYMITWFQLASAVVVVFWDPTTLLQLVLLQTWSIIIRIIILSLHHLNKSPNVMNWKRKSAKL